VLKNVSHVTVTQEKKHLSGRI